jgi:hypothetical protein
MAYSVDAIMHHRLRQIKLRAILILLNACDSCDLGVLNKITLFRCRTTEPKQGGFGQMVKSAMLTFPCADTAD